MAAPYPAPVSNYHINTYPAIDPKRPELSVKGKTVIITGAGVGIGRETAKEFAVAGAKDIHIIGRTKSTLEETKSIIAKEAPNVTVEIYIADVADEVAIQDAVKAIGPWDVLVHNAGYLSKRYSVPESDTKDWWQSFEVSSIITGASYTQQGFANKAFSLQTNVKGSFVVTKYFIPTRKANASLVALSTAAISIPVNMVAGAAAYSTSKLAMVKFFEFIAAETPGLQVITIHPGLIETAMSIKSEMPIEQFDDSE
jgi:NAD(P)-dependent dehydrogenase (short-subunit alcohol dehydrogenase family)